MTARKKDLLKKLIDTADEATLAKVAAILEEPQSKILDYAQPIKERLDIEALIKEQGYDSTGLIKLMKNWDFSIWQDEDFKYGIE